MPLWLGANEAPMYRPKTASCTPRNANAMPSGRKQEDDGEVDRELRTVSSNDLERALVDLAA